MTIRSSGLWCDVCGNPILFDPYQQFKIHNLEVGGKKDVMLHACSECAPALHASSGTGNWVDLPEGPLKEAYAKAEGKCQDD